MSQQPLLQNQVKNVRWARKESNNSLVLEGKDRLQLPMSRNGQELELDLSDYSFIAPGNGWYIMRATVDLGIGPREYQLQIRFDEERDSTVCKVLECFNGKCCDIPERHLELGLFLGDQLFKALCSPGGIKLSEKYLKHSPMHLFDAWTDHAREQLLRPI